jgi:hypothetical protein
MKPPPGRRIVIGHDPTGFPTISWEVMNPAKARAMASVLAVVATVLASNGYTFPIDLWRLIRSWSTANPHWLGLALTGVGSVVFLVPAAAVAVIAFRLAFRPRPERFTLEGSRLIYAPGSALFGLETGRSSGLPLVWKILRGGARLDISKDDFGGASVGVSKRQVYVRLEVRDRQWRVGHRLDRKEQDWLAEALQEWKRRG